MRITALWTGMSPYASDCFDALVRAGHTVTVLAFPPVAAAPFDLQALGALYDLRPSTHSVDELVKVMDGSDVVLCAGWAVSGYARAVRRVSARLKVMTMDNPWEGTLKQRAGELYGRLSLSRTFDVAWVPGERQRVFAQRLGFDEVWTGLYCSRDKGVTRTPQERFLFVGRLVHDKGVDVMLKAYAQYRKATPRAWPLDVFGTGPLPVTGDGVVRHGFAQPEDLARAMVAGGCLVLPSRSEHWGMAVQEATMAALPVIVSDACGCVPHLVEHRCSGLVVPAGDPNRLAAALAEMAGADEDRRMSMGALGRGLALRYTPETWVARIEASQR